MVADARRLAFLLAIHRSGGVLAAASALRVTPSAVSQQIARLEAEEHVVVLDRGPRGVTLTPAGRVLAEAAERIENELVEARRAVAALNEEISGRVVIGSIQTGIRAVVMPVVMALAERLPGVDLVVEERDALDAVRSLRAGELDIVIIERDVAVSRSDAPRSFRDIVLLDEPWRILIPADVPDPTHLGDLADAVWLGPQPETAGELALRRVERELNTKLTTRHLYYGLETALAMVAEGLGIAMVPALALWNNQLPDRVAVSRLPGLGTRGLVLRHRVSRHDPRPVVSAVIDELVEQAAQIDLG